jgi:peptide-methionine (S)-S-oxide reductase
MQLVSILLLMSLSMLSWAETQKFQTASAMFAGGCFWCMERPFDKLDGVISTNSGYSGGHIDNPTYEQVSAGKSGHIEVLQVIYDPAKVSYQQLLQTFWVNIDPLDGGGQFCDRGSHYAAAIFYSTEAQREAAQDSLLVLAESGRFETPIQTQLLAAAKFYPAENYHQNYYQRNPVRYKYYRWNCGRDQRLSEVWGEHAAH